MKKKKKLTTTQTIILGFLGVILVGAFLLCFPFASASGEWTSPLDALFTATTSVCVTGLVVVNTYEYWSIIGQVIILILIQFGGLGIVTLTSGVLLMATGKGSLYGKLLLESSFNLNGLSGLSGFISKTIIGTFVVELAGAICYSFAFIPMYGPIRGVWFSVFHAVSAFCNAGIDLIGPSSFVPFVNHVWINIVTMLLIFLSGLGFIVWWDTIRVAKMVKEKDIPVRGCFKRLTLHSKIVYVMTFTLIISGAIIVFCFEYNNPETLGSMPFGEKVLASCFQSVTLRTAGFMTISQKALRDVTAVVCLLYMFIGGSPVGTAGGIKTATFALILLAAFSVAKGEEEASCYKRTIPNKVVRKAMAVGMFSFLACFVAVVALSLITGGDIVDVAYEAFSALGTVGLSRDFTSTLGVAGKILIIICMFLGRIGPISIVIAFHAKQGNKRVEYAKEEITVG